MEMWLHNLNGQGRGISERSLGRLLHTSGVSSSIRKLRKLECEVLGCPRAISETGWLPFGDLRFCTFCGLGPMANVNLNGCMALGAGGISMEICGVAESKDSRESSVWYGRPFIKEQGVCYAKTRPMTIFE
jgi:hypothetical protein